MFFITPIIFRSRFSPGFYIGIQIFYLWCNNDDTKKTFHQKTELPLHKEEKNERTFPIVIDPFPATTSPGPVFEKIHSF